MGGSFAARARFAIYSGPVSGARTWVTVPVWAHRVTAPLVKRRGLDLFQRVILGLSEAGVRRPDRIGELTGLHPRLCAYIMDGARQQGLLGKNDEVTEEGTRALRTSVVTEDTEWSVRYVFTDPASGVLWPRAANRIDHAYVVDVSHTHVTVRLGPAGGPAIVKALRMPVDGLGQELPTARPRPERVLEALHRDQVARDTLRRQELERQRNVGPAPDGTDFGADLARIAMQEQLPELTRIAFIDDPVPIEIVSVIQIAPSDAPGPGWIAHDPFGVGVNSMFSDLLAGWLVRHPALADDIERMVGKRDEEFARQYRKNQRQARERAAETLVREHGPELRSDQGVLDKLVDARLAEVERSTGKAMHATFALFEELVFRLCVAYPISAADAVYFSQARKGGKAAETKPDAPRSQETVSEKIRRSGEAIGAYEVPSPYLVSAAHLDAVATSDRPSNGTNFATLVAACIFAAVRRDDHPLRSMLKQRPSILFDLNELRNGRNGQAHRLGADPVEEDLHWCHDLAALAVPFLLSVPASP